ncbi:carboxypeptidase C [Coprinopsis sp. MPI-PUGE-AT-0042]|nr:carboxypeptidase C [Coprinopsis sp. MPI-PUGE-AT-0042]
MRLYQAISVLAALGLVPAYAAPSLFDDAQRVLSNPFLDQARHDVKDIASQYLSDAKRAVLKGKKNLEKWYHDGREFIKQDNLLYELVTHPLFETQQLRVTEPDLCDSSVKQYSGIPRCLLFELGPCSIADGGRNITNNPHSWNTHANIIFLDQPVNVGFSYADGVTSVNSSPIAGKDVYAFLELFLNRFPEYSTQPFHLAAESYGGTYAPNFANIIYKSNKELSLKPDSRLKHINLASVVLANGLTDPYVQYGSIADWACDGPYPVYDDPMGPQCQALRGKIPTCQRLINSCYKFNSKFTCVPAVLYCNSQIFAPLMQTGRNPYDVRLKCDRAKDGDLCYKQMSWIETWMNDPKVKATLGVSPDRNFASCNMEVNQAFTMNGDGMHNSALLLPELINDGVKLLVYAGNADMMCNYMGNERWVEAMETKFSEKFRRTRSVPWTPMRADLVNGEIRTAGNVTFLNIHEAGHMVPYDQPEAALAMITRWILDIPLTLPGPGAAATSEEASIPPL